MHLHTYIHTYIKFDLVPHMSCIMPTLDFDITLIRIQAENAQDKKRGE